MNIRNLFEEKKCVFSFEMFPPKKNSDDINAMYETIDGLKRLGPDYISITYGAGGSGGRGTERLADAGIAYATEQIADLIAGGVRGIHVYVMNNVEVAARITENVRSMLNRVNND